jgi:hypothetical protein
MAKRKAFKGSPRRLCADPQTKYCKGHKNSKYPYGHRGCCECWEHNAGDDWNQPCNPYLLPENVAETKIWWEENDMGPWDEDDTPMTRRNRKKRGKK